MQREHLLSGWSCVWDTCPSCTSCARLTRLLERLNVLSEWDRWYVWRCTMDRSDVVFAGDTSGLLWISQFISSNSGELELIRWLSYFIHVSILTHPKVQMGAFSRCNKDCIVIPFISRFSETFSTVNILNIEEMGFLSTRRTSYVSSHLCSGA